MRTEAESAWLKAMRDTDTAAAASGLMHDWYLAMKLYHPLPLTPDLDACLATREWQQARISLKRTYGSSPAHQFMLLMLDEAVEKSRPAAALANGADAFTPFRPHLTPFSDASELTRFFGR